MEADQAGTGSRAADGAAEQLDHVQIVADVGQRNGTVAGGGDAQRIRSQHRSGTDLLHQADCIDGECAVGRDVGEIGRSARGNGNRAGIGLVAVVLAHDETAAAAGDDRDRAVTAGPQVQRIAGRTGGMGHRGATDRDVAAGRNDALGKVDFLLGLDADIARAGGDQVVHLHVAGRRRRAGGQRDAAGRGGQVARRGQVAIQRAEFDIARRGADVFRRQHQTRARPQLDRCGRSQIAGERVHAELVGVLHADLGAGGINRNLAGEVVEGAEQIDVCGTAVDFSGGRFDAGGGFLGNADTAQGQAVAGAAAGIQRKGVEIQDAIGGLDFRGAADGDVTGQFQASRARAALILQGHRAGGGKRAQIVEIRLVQRHHAGVAGQGRSGNDAVHIDPLNRTGQGFGRRRRG